MTTPAPDPMPSRAPAPSPAPAAHGQPPSARTVLLAATRKGAWLLHRGPADADWTMDGPHFLGHDVHHLVLDPRDGRTLLATVRTGHLGPTIFRSQDLGATWTEAARPPAFANANPALPARAVHHTFWLTPGHADEPGTWWAGTSPQGLFQSRDGGHTWAPLASVNDDARFRAWMGTAQDGTPDGPKLHSILVDPRDPAHLMFAMSGGGVHESQDGGAHWAPAIEGMEVVEGFDAADVSFHDPHCLRRCPARPDRLYQQNHCGIYRRDGVGQPWVRVGRAMPAEVGDIGFPLVVHPRDPDTAWVFPMDGTTVWPRTSPGGRPAAWVTRDGGAHWQRLDAGLPRAQAWWTVKRQALAVDAQPRPALYLGTTSGELWVGHDEGAQWALLARHLPAIQAVEVAGVTAVAGVAGVAGVATAAAPMTSTATATSTARSPSAAMSPSAATMAVPVGAP